MIARTSASARPLLATTRRTCSSFRAVDDQHSIDAGQPAALEQQRDDQQP
jgi:hypothetical protein